MRNIVVYVCLIIACVALGWYLPQLLGVVQ